MTLSELDMARDLLMRWRHGDQTEQLQEQTAAYLRWLSRYEKETCHPEEATSVE